MADIVTPVIIIIIMYIYHALINALGAHVVYIVIKLNTIFYTHVEHSPIKTIYIKYYMGAGITNKRTFCCSTHTIGHFITAL